MEVCCKIRHELEVFRCSILILFLFVANYNFAQTDYPRDTSFTVNSAWNKVKKKYPYTSPVTSTKSDKIIGLSNQVYRVRGNRMLHMDIFMKPGTDSCSRPVVLMIHGGGWRSGDKSHLKPLAMFLAHNNYVAVPVEYRLSKEARYPAAIYDLKEALRFFKA